MSTEEDRDTRKLGRDALNEWFGGRLLYGATIIEHRTDGANVVGAIVYTAGAHADGSVGVGWEDDFNRTTQFFPHSWEVRAHKRRNVVFIKRIAPDTGDTDMPWRECNLYTIIPREVRGMR